MRASDSAPITTAWSSKSGPTDASPGRCLTQASAILQHHLDVFVGYDKPPSNLKKVVDKQDEEKPKLKKLLNNEASTEIELSVRAANCLNNANITTVGQLAMKTSPKCSSTGISARNP